MEGIKAINIVGESGTGKTRTVEFIVKKLTEEGKRVGTVKHIHSNDFSLDKKGKDTWRHLKAGAFLVMAITESEIITIKRIETKSLSYEDLIRVFEGQVDYLVIEGFKEIKPSFSTIRILCISEQKQIESFIKNFGKPDFIVSYNIKGLKEVNSIPVIFMPDEAKRLYQILKERV
ncbi:MAG: molybdopterin-guanine dinucleotide biosynthesis protein B [Nitrososphaeria archaeon]|jgi:molybdopterin-guanine dinucleotide biosynthesis protein MobB